MMMTIITSLLLLLLYDYYYYYYIILLLLQKQYFAFKAELILLTKISSYKKLKSKFSLFRERLVEMTSSLCEQILYSYFICLTAS